MFTREAVRSALRTGTARLRAAAGTRRGPRAVRPLQGRQQQGRLLRGRTLALSWLRPALLLSAHL